MNLSCPQSRTPTTTTENDHDRAETTDLPQEEIERVHGGYSYDSAGRHLVATDQGVYRGDETYGYILIGTPPGN